MPPRCRLLRAIGLLAPVVFCLGCPEPEPVPVEPAPELDMARVLKLEDERSLGEGELASHLTDADDLVRARAALAIGRIGGSQASAQLAPLLGDPSPHVRANAAFSLGILEGAIDSDAVAALTAALADSEPRVRGRAAEALARKEGVKAAGTIGTALLEQLPKGGEPYEWNDPLATSSLLLPHIDLRLGLFALARLSSAEWCSKLIATEGRTPRFSWWPAALVASEFEGDELLPIHLYYAGSPDPTLRFYGARGLGMLEAERPRDYVRQLLFDPNEKVRIEAVRASARLGLVELVPDLLSHLKADTRYVQAEILIALGSLRDPAAVEPLVDRIGDESPWTRSLALAALAHQDPDDFWLLLSGVGSDASWRVRRSVAMLLRTLDARRSHALLIAMAEDPDARVRTEALRTLGLHDPRGSSEIFIRHLSGQDPFERVAAAEALAAAGTEGAFAPVEQAFLLAAREDPRLRADLLEALVRIDPARAEATVRQALEDTSFLLRSRAAAILERSSTEDIPVRPRSSERGLPDYEELLEAPYSPQAFLRTSRGSIEIELFIDDAPQTVSNFIRLSRGGFFDGLEFYQVIPNGYVASGDPRGDGSGGPNYTIRSEINERPFLRGTLAMVEEGKDTGGSRFLIAHMPDMSREGLTTVFGQVINGMEVVDGLEPGDVIEQATIWDGVTSPYRTEPSRAGVGPGAREGARRAPVLKRAGVGPRAH
jgi:HEAT repeat protein/cyclophilin family peptidyl-prolyl cis-trans isomerase